MKLTHYQPATAKVIVAFLCLILLLIALVEFGPFLYFWVVCHFAYCDL